MNPIAFVGIDRQIHLIRPDGSGQSQLTASVPTRLGAWTLLRAPQDAWSWPTWSPDAQWIAAFGVEVTDQGSGPVRVVALSLDGVREVEWAEIQGMAPIYLQWHPEGDALDVLLQQDDELVLGLVERDRIGQLRTLEHGVPLFFTWSPGGERLLVHAGHGSHVDGRIVLRDPLGRAPDVVYDDRPGSFCAPVFAGGRAVYAGRGERPGESVVLASDPDGQHPRPLLTRDGLLAIVAEPGAGPRVAVSHAPRGEGTPYQGIDVVDVETGVVTRVSDQPCLAFFWSPRGDWLLQAQVDADNNCIHWHRVEVDGSAAVHLASFWPTRDLLFFLHFFDQYALSHSLLSPDGARLVYAGYPAGEGQADLSMPPRIWVKDVTDPARPPIEIARGSFAVYAPRE